MVRRLRESRGNIEIYKILVNGMGWATVHVDDYEQGEGKFVHDWDFDVRGTYDSIESLIAEVSSTCGCGSTDVKDWGLLVDNGTIATNCLVDEDDLEADQRQIEKWKRGEYTLYICDIMVPIQIVTEPRDVTEEDADLMGIQVW